MRLAGIGVQVAAAGIEYLEIILARLFVPDYTAVATTVFMTPALASELGLTVWLLMKGMRAYAFGHGEAQG